MKKNILWILIAIFLFFSMITNTKEIYTASIIGLNTWAKILVPSLLPFMIVANLLMRLGIINFLGVLMEPLMRPIFNVSGTGGFVLAIGFTSGFPISSVLTADLRQQKKITQDEAERLISFTNNASPLFMFSAIAIGMFDYPALGIALAGGHYCSNIILGIIMGLRSARVPHEPNRRNIIITALQSIRHTSPAPIGQILGEAVNKSIKNMLSIGGFVVFFAIALASIKAIGLLGLLEVIIGAMLSWLFIDQTLANSVVTGFFELTLGVKEASESQANLYQQVAIAAAILAWNGLSIHAQVASFISTTDISIKPFIMTRLAQTLLAPIITIFLFHRHEAAFAQLYNSRAVEHLSLMATPWSWWWFGFWGLSLIIGSLILGGLLISLVKSIFRIASKL